MDPYFIISVQEDTSKELRAEIAETKGVTPLWEAQIFSQLTVSIEHQESAVISELEALDGVEHVVEERIGENNTMQLEHPAKFYIEPTFDVDAETDRIVNEELSKVTNQYKSPTFDGITVNEFKNQRIGIIDSGIDVRNPQVTNVVERVNFTEDDEFDSVGHGTVMACVVNVQRPNCDLVDLKVLGQETIRESNIIQALAEATDPKHRIDAVSMSLGLEPRDGYCPLCDAVNRTHHSGIPVTVSSGQLARPKAQAVPPMCPARAENAVAVTADSDKRSNMWFAEGDVMAKSDWVMTFNERE